MNATTHHDATESHDVVTGRRSPMGRRTRLAGILAASLLWSPGVSAQTSEVPAVAQPVVTVDLGMDAAMPGEQASLSVLLSTTGAPDIGVLDLEVVLPAQVSFVKLTKGLAAQNSDADVKAEVMRSKDSPDGSILRVHVSASKPIRRGTLMSLTFDVSKDAPGDGELKLKAAKVTALAMDGSGLVAHGIDGSIAVISADPTLAACFFYMH